ncbi:MAG: leucine-rich repeat domain-containing protein [Paludibacter sp.]
MKKRLSLFTLALFSMVAAAQVSKTVNVTTAGNLYRETSLNTVTNLTVTGSINAVDVKYMRDNMPLLAVLDLSGASIAAYSGSSTDGPDTNISTYNANYMPSKSFRNKSSLTTLNLPNNLTGIDQYAFYGCSGLTSIPLPANLISIGGEAFSGCTSLTSMTFPAKLRIIYDAETANPATYKAFFNCTHITDFNVESTNANFSSLNGVLFNKDFTKLLCYPMAKLGDFTIPSTVTNINCWAFYKCMVPKITFPVIPSAFTINDYAISNCSNLIAINCLDVTPFTITALTFNNNSNIANVFVPSADAVTAYKANTSWYSTFPGNIIKTGVTTALALQTSSKVKVFTTASEIVIDGLSNGATVELYSLNGVRIQSRKAQGDRMTINILGHAVYLVKVGAKAFKVIL